MILASNQYLARRAVKLGDSCSTAGISFAVVSDDDLMGAVVPE